MVVYNNGTLQRQPEAGWRIAMDKNGTLWWASAGKLISYDGSAFKTISCSAIPSSNIFKLAVGNDQTKWIATWSGLIKVDSSGASYTYTSRNSGMPHTEAEAVCLDDQMNVWVGTHEGAAMFSQQGYQNKATSFPPHANVIKTTHTFGMCMPGQKCFDVFIPMPAIAHFRIFDLSGRLVTSFSHDYSASGSYSIPVQFAKSGLHMANNIPFLWRMNLYSKGKSLSF
jgi:hypothetical protein